MNNSFCCTKISGFNLSAFIYRLLDENLSSIVGLKVISGTEYVTLSRTDFHVTYTFPGSVLLARAFGIRMRSPVTLLLAE